MLDKVRKEYNDLMEKHLKTPKKVTTVTTTVDHDHSTIETPQIEDKGLPRNRQIQADEGCELSEKEIQVGDSSKLD